MGRVSRLQQGTEVWSKLRIGGVLGVSGTGNVRGGGTCRDNDPSYGNRTACSRSRG